MSAKQVGNNAVSHQLRFALDVCQQAGQIALAQFKSKVESVLKADGSPVTAADRDCERLIREAIAKEFPQDAVLGEEEGESQSGQASLRKWIVDPIDGTYNYARGIPIFSTLLALEVEGEIVLGIIHAPALKHTYWAELGRGAFKNGQRINVSDCQDFGKSQFNFGALSRILGEGYWEGFQRLVASTYRQRGLGDYLNFALVLEGKSEATLEIGVKPWDLAPMKILVEESGGRYDDLEGGRSIYTGKCLVSNGHLHAKYKETLLAVESS